MEIVIDDLGGNCPVQAKGTIGGLPFYFRARGSGWSMSVASKKDGDVFDDDSWGYYEDYGDGPYDAGWMENEEAEKFVYESLKRYQTRQSAQN